MALSPAAAQRNVVAAAAAGCIGFAGFTLVMPFLPLYIRELGTSDVGEIALWTGLTLGATPAITAISAPFWGRVGDRYGSKVLVLRSLAAFVLTKGAMAFVTAPWQLFALRALLGLFAGYGALTVSMAAESVPRDRMASAIGTVQMGHRLGPAIGPIIGGLLAPVVGLRNSFLVAAALYLLALVLVWATYQEPRTREARRPSRPMGVVLAELIGTPGFLLLLGAIFSFQMVDRSLGPILPIYVAELGVSDGRIALVSGVLFSLVALTAAVGHRVAAMLVARWRSAALIVWSAVAGGVALGVLLLLPTIWTFALALMVCGVAIGIGMTAAFAAAGALLPADAHATGFGVMTTANLVGLAVSPVIAGMVGAHSLSVVFLLDVVLLAVLAVIVSRSRQTTGPRTIAAAEATTAVEP